MSRTIHLCKGDIIHNPAIGSSSRSITIEDGYVIAIDQDPPIGAMNIDLEGQCAIPGFIDSHLHLTQGASGLGDVDLRRTKTEEAFSSELLEGSARVLEGEWLVASGWSEQVLGSTPQRSWIPSGITIPTICFRVDLHAALINQALLQILDHSTIMNMVGGEDIQEGIVKEDALFHGICPRIPTTPLARRIEYTKRVVQDLLKNGITLVGSMESINDIDEILVPIHASNRMRIRVMCLDQPTQQNVDRCRTFPCDSMLEVKGFKAFLDGSLGSRTAKMYDAWNDASGSGMWAGVAAEGELDAWVQRVHDAGFASVIHAIGDQAVGLALGALKLVKTDLLSRIEHAQFIADHDLPNIDGHWFGVQPLHQPDDAKVAEEAVGMQRAKQLHNWRRMLDAGAKLSFGSDWPVAPYTPIDAMAVAIQQGLSPKEALVASTQDAATSLWTEHSGKLEVGCYGDVAILDRNPLDCDWNTHNPSVTMTILSGNIVYDGSASCTYD